MLKLGTKAIDDLDIILQKGATAEQIVKLRFEVPGMSLTKLRQLLEKPGMQPDILVNLFKKLSISELEDLLSIAGMSPSLLLELLDKPGITASTLKALLKRIGISPETLLKALNNNVKVKDLEYLSNLPGMSATKLQNLSDAEFQAAAEAARIERLDGGHSLDRHGSQVEDSALQDRITTGIAPDGVVSPFSPSTKFKSYKDWLETRQQVLDQAFQAVKGVDLKYGPGVGGNSMKADYNVIVEFPSRDLGEGFYGTGSRIQIPDPRGPRSNGSPRPDLNVWTGTAPINSGVNRTSTSIKWVADPTLSNGGRWVVTQHIPYAKDFNPATNTYTQSAQYIIP